MMSLYSDCSELYSPRQNCSYAGICALAISATVSKRLCRYTLTSTSAPAEPRCLLLLVHTQNVLDGTPLFRATLFCTTPTRATGIWPRITNHSVIQNQYHHQSPLYQRWPINATRPESSIWIRISHSNGEDHSESTNNQNHYHSRITTIIIVNHNHHHHNHNLHHNLIPEIESLHQTIIQSKIQSIYQSYHQPTTMNQSNLTHSEPTNRPKS
jgi:hypothetical protein